MKSRNLEQIFPPADLERITNAVQEAERKTSGEIVTYVVPKSDSYRETIWRSALVATGSVLLLFGFIPFVSDIWMPIGISGVVAIALAAGIIGGLLTLYIPALRRRFAGEAVIRQRVAARAAQAFLAEEVFNTRNRTGILIFLSLMEHRVVVLGDSGINAVVQQNEWDDITRIIADGIRQRRPADGLENAIVRCGALLAGRGFAIPPADTNELPNPLRLGD